MADTRFPGNDPLYSRLSPAHLPQSESPKDTLARLLPFRHDGAIPELHRVKHRLIVAHHDSRGGLLKYLDNISDADIATITIRTADPILYELNEHIVPVGRENLCPRSKLTNSFRKY